MSRRDEPTLTITTPTDREVVMTRLFDASPNLVFDAMTRPELLKQWLEAPGRTLAVCESDLKAGGRYRYVWRGPGKSDVGMHGVFREVSRPDRYVRTESWEDWDAGESVVTTVLTKQNGKTLLTVTQLFPSRAVRDEVVKAGLQHTADASFAKLAALLNSVAAGD
jgi:uncharacterized protein YndB with AHSA1/START domain